MDRLDEGSKKGHKDGPSTEKQPYEQRLRELPLFSQGKRRLRISYHHDPVFKWWLQQRLLLYKESQGVTVVRLSPVILSSPASGLTGCKSPRLCSGVRVPVAAQQ